MTNWIITGAVVLRVRVAIKKGTLERQCDALANQGKAA
jgi:uncharacterized membrane protein YciS (DUF1049 family)